MSEPTPPSPSKSDKEKAPKTNELVVDPSLMASISPKSFVDTMNAMRSMISDATGYPVQPSQIIKPKVFNAYNFSKEMAYSSYTLDSIDERTFASYQQQLDADIGRTVMGLVRAAHSDLGMNEFRIVVRCAPCTSLDELRRLGASQNSGQVRQKWHVEIRGPNGETTYNVVSHKQLNSSVLYSQLAYDSPIEPMDFIPPKPKVVKANYSKNKVLIKRMRAMYSMVEHYINTSLDSPAVYLSNYIIANKSERSSHTDEEIANDSTARRVWGVFYGCDLPDDLGNAPLANYEKVINLSQAHTTAMQTMEYLNRKIKELENK